MTEDLLTIAIRNAKEIIAAPSLVTEEELKIIKIFLKEESNKSKFSNKQLFVILNISTKARRKSFKLHKHAKRAYGA